LRGRREPVEYPPMPTHHTRLADFLHSTGRGLRLTTLGRLSGEADIVVLVRKADPHATISIDAFENQSGGRVPDSCPISVTPNRSYPAGVDLQTGPISD
jgi:hypothetical protein